LEQDQQNPEASGIDLQPTLQNDRVILQPLQAEDLDALHAVASDPAVWQFHPNKDRWKREVFATFFQGAMASGGAFRILDARTGSIIGSTRFYDHDPAKKSLFIGYTFFAVDHWRKGYNLAVKRLMLDHAFQHVDIVRFHIGAENFPSQRSIVKLGAQKEGEAIIAYFGEPPRRNFTYFLTRSMWADARNNIQPNAID
jgi:RimJ/RimL family protein N-acetyltransferase